MSRAVVTLPRAKLDLIRVYLYLRGQASQATARRFLVVVEKTLALLTKTPGIGHPHETDQARLAGLRFIPIVSFKRYILFYMTTDDSIEVVRVLHGSRDISRILNEEQD